MADPIVPDIFTLQGIQMQPSEATLFRKRLLAGEWQGALELLPRLLAGQAGMHDEIESEARYVHAGPLAHKPHTAEQSHA
jgi:hypothetical protein